MKLTPKQVRTLRRIKKKYNVSAPFILSNMANIRKFVWYAMCPRLVIKRMAVRRQPNQRIVLEHYRLRRVLFDQSLMKIIKRRKRNVSQWSQSMVQYLRRTLGVKEYVEDHLIQTTPKLSSEDVNKQVKAQLELLKCGKRTMPLFNSTLINNDKEPTEKTDGQSSTQLFENLNISEMTPEKQMITDDQQLSDAEILENLHNRRYSGGSTDKTEHSEETAECEATKEPIEKVTLKGSNFIDMLMRKVGSSPSRTIVCLEADNSISSHEDFAGFEEDVIMDKRHTFAPALLPTPIVTSENSIFESEKLDTYMRANALESKSTDESAQTKKKIQKYGEDKKPQLTAGLVTPYCTPPTIEKPLVPESLQRLRTVAERRNYLQRHARNYRLSIINNEATIYRDLQRKSKRRSSSMYSLQSAENQVPFTREGWRAASFLSTDLNKYYFQVLPVDDATTFVRLAGVRGNNTEYYLPRYCSHAQQQRSAKCPPNCIDAIISQQFKMLKTQYKSNKLIGAPLRAVLPACPLSCKPFQKPLDDDTAALLTAGGNMLIVRVPTVELEVFPELGKPLDELAKRYMEHIIPHENITPEWAKFSVSTLVEPTSTDKNVKMNSTGTRESYVFPIPYANERSQILARYVIDRSEKLDKSFQNVATDCAQTDLTFCANIDTSDEDLVECANIVSDMINCVAISCSENSFIKDDPDENYTRNIIEEENNKARKSDILPALSSTQNIKINDHKPATHKKQNCQM